MYYKESDRPVDISQEGEASLKHSMSDITQSRKEFMELLKESLDRLYTFIPRSRTRFIPAICSLFCHVRFRLSVICGQWTEILSETMDDCDISRVDDLFEWTAFVMNVCSAIVNALNTSNSSKGVISASVDIGLLHPLPWSDAVSLAQGSLFISDKDARTWNMAESLVPLSHAVLEDETTEDHHWSLFLMEIEAIEGSYSLLQYLNRLSRVLGMYQPKKQQCVHDQSSDNECFETIDGKISHLVNMCLVVQNESLFTVNCFMCSCRSEGYLKYKYLGSSLINSILIDITVQSTYVDMKVALQYQLGMLSFRQHELAMMQSYYMSGDEKISDEGLISDSISGFMSWIAKYFRLDAWPKGGSACFDVVASAPSSIPVPEYFPGSRVTDIDNDTTLWPWGGCAPSAPDVNTVPLGYTGTCWIPVRGFQLLDYGPSTNELFCWADVLHKLIIKDKKSSIKKDDKSTDVLEITPPWFIRGISGRAWLMFFNSLYNVYFSNGHSVSKMQPMIKMMIGAILSSIGATKSGNTSNESPFLQVHIILFLSLCLRTAPEVIVPVAREVGLWDILLCSNYFLLGGCQSVSDLLSNNRVTTVKTDCSKDSFSTIGCKAPSDMIVRSTLDGSDLEWPLMLGYMWLYLHDALFSLFNETIQLCIKSSVGGYPRLEIIKFFEAFKSFGQSGADDLVFQGARWISYLIEAGKGQRDSVSTVPEFLSVIISLNICGQQVVLLDSLSQENEDGADNSGSGGHTKKDISSRLMDPVPGRPLLWHARSALIELILRVKVVSSHPKWLDVYLTSSHQPTKDSVVLGSGSPTADAIEIPAKYSAEDSDDLGSTTGVSPLQSSRSSKIRLGSESSNSNSGSPVRQGGKSSSIVSTSGQRNPPQQVRIPSVNTLRYLMSDTRCLAAISFIFGEICFRAVDSIVSVEAKKIKSRTETASSVDAKSISSLSTLPDHISEQNKSWLAAMRTAESDAIYHKSGEISPVPRISRRRSKSSGESTIINNLIAVDPVSNPLSPLLSAVSKFTVSAQQLVSEIVRVLFDQVRTYGKVQPISEAVGCAARILGQLLRIFRESSGTNLLCLQDIWIKKHMWSVQFGSALSFLKSIVSSNDDTSSMGGIQIFHLNLTLLVSIMTGNNACRDSFRDFMMFSGSAQSLSRSRTSSWSTPSRGRKRSSSFRSDYGLDHPLFDPNERIPHRFLELRAMLSAALYPSLENRSYRATETILILMELLFDGPVLPSKKLMSAAKEDDDIFIKGFFQSNEDRPRIINTIAIPILTNLFPLFHVNDQICIVNSFHGLVTGSASLYNLAKCTNMNPSMLNLLLEAFPGMPVIVKEASVFLLQALGRHSISVSQLKKIFRMVQSRGDFRPAYTSHLLHAVKGMISEDEEPRHSFVFDGEDSGLQLPCINKWPAPRGYSFSVWMRVETPRNGKTTLTSETESRKKKTTDTKISVYRPYVISLRCRTGIGLDICLHDGGGKGKYKICISTYSAGNECCSVVLPGLYITEGSWHYFSISHAARGAFSSAGLLSVLLDDQYLRLKDSLPFPKFNDSIELPLIGDLPKKYRGRNLTSFRGQLSAIYFFSEALSEGQLRGIRGLGPSYVYSFEQHNIVHHDIALKQSSKKQAVDPVLTALDGSLTSLIMLAYNPAVWSDDYFLDNTPDQNNVKWGGGATSFFSEDNRSNSRMPRLSTPHESELPDRFQISPKAGKMHALRRKGTYRSTSQDAKIALDSLGGIKVLLPLFAQFDQPRLAPVATDDQSTYSSSVVDKPFLDNELSQVVLELLFMLVDGKNSSLLSESNGFSLISYLLERVSPGHLTCYAANVLWQLRDRLFWSPMLQDQLLEHILSNFNLWVYSQYDVQLLCLDRLLDLCAESYDRFREALPVQRLLDALLLLYYYEEPVIGDMPIESCTTQNSRSDSPVIAKDVSPIPPVVNNLEDEEDDIVIDQTGIAFDPKDQDEGSNFKVCDETLSVLISRSRIVGQKAKAESFALKEEELAELRSKLFKILHTLIVCNTGGISADDLQALVGYAQVTTCERSKAEALRLILRIVSIPSEEADTKVPRLFSALSKCKCFQAILKLHTHESAKVRLYIFLLLCKLIYLSCLYTLPEALRQQMVTHQTKPKSGGSVLPEVTESENVFGAATLNNPSASSLSDQPTNLPNVNADKSVVTKADDLYFLDLVGIPISHLGDTVLLVIDGLCEKIRHDIRNSNKFDSKSVRLQCRTIAQALQSTLLGDSCDYLVFDIDNIDIRQTADMHSVDENAAKQEVHSSPGDTVQEIEDPPNLPKGGYAGCKVDLLDPLGVKHAPDGILLNTPTDVDSAKFDFSESSVSKSLSSLANGPRKKTAIRAERPDGFLNGSTVCAPMLFPAILSMVRFEGLQVSLGLSVLVNLKTVVLQSDHNADAILSTAHWQYWILELIVSERTRLRILQRKCSEVSSDNSSLNDETFSVKESRRRMEKSAALIDTCIRMICDLQLIAVRLGRLLYKPMLYNPLKTYQQRIPGVVVLKDIARGKRQLGAIVLRDTMSYFRMYGEQGELNAQDSGFALLLQILFSLQLEKTLQANKTVPSTLSVDDDYATRVATLSKWLIGAVVFDFISVPITQGNSHNAEKAVSPSASVEPGGKPRRRLKSVSFDCLSSDSSDRASDSVSSVSIEGASTDDIYSKLPPPTNLFGTEIDCACGHKIKNDLQALIEGRVEKTWELVDGLLTMYGPLNNATTWGVVGMKLKAVGKIGFLTGISALSHISDGIEQILPPTNLNQGNGPVPGSGNVFRISGTPSKGAGKLDSPLVSTACVVCWLLTRVLESIYLAGSDSSTIHAISIKALSKLRVLLDGLRNVGAEFVVFESRNLISRLSTGLSSAHLPFSSEWARAGMVYLCELLLSQRSYFVDMVTNILSTSSDSTKEFGPSGLEDGSPDSSPGTVVDLCFRNALPDSGTRDVVFSVVKASLCLCAEAESALTWDLWLSIVEPISSEINRLENEILLASLNDIGLHKHTQELRKDLGQSKMTSRLLWNETMSDIDNAQSVLYSSQLKGISRAFKQKDRHYRFNTRKWSEIVSELANERGPWGCSTEHQSDVHWMMDVATTSDFRRPRLKRNQHITDHSTAVLLTRGADGTPSGEVVSAEPALLSAPSEKSEGGLAQGLWRDLVKYQRKDLSVPERADDDVDLLEEGDLVEDSSTIQGNVGDISANVGAGTTVGATSENEKSLFKEDCEIITWSANSSAGGTVGILEVYKGKIVFLKTSDFDYLSLGQKLGNTDFIWACQNFPSSAWSCSHIVHVYQRSYQLRFVAVEIFFTNRSSVFINLHDSAKAELLLTTIRRKVRPPHISPYFGRTPKVIMNRFTLHGDINPISVTEAWQCREISNYEYLTYLNFIAGRSLNDLGQYPVFPWVLADYTSKKLDLRNPGSFRDFNFPMGAQREEQRKQFIEKYYDLKANYDADKEYAKKHNLPSVDTLPPFHYGSHYSCMGFVLWYLVRHEPFTSLNVWLQDGRFDRPDRLFDSIEAAWRGCTTNQSDVKELIPEFFYNSDFLDNYNGVDLGTTQTGRHIGAVKLPRWAKNSQDFIYQHREALESDYVSMNLHHWIDLVFGFKQRPPHMGGDQSAVDSVNVYFHLTYAGAVDLDQLKESDPYLYGQTVRQIDNFGQTPAQLFDKPHVQRLPFDKCDIIWPMASVVRGVDTIPKGQPPLQKPRKVICFKFHKLSDYPIIFIGEASAIERLVTVDSSRIVGWHFWQVRQPDVVPPYQLKVDAQALKISQGFTATSPFSIFPSSYQAISRDRRVGAPFAPQELFSQLNLVETPPLYATNKRLFCQEETERLNTKGSLLSSAEQISGRSRAGTLNSGKSKTRNVKSSAVAYATGGPNNRSGIHDSKRFMTTGSGENQIMSTSRPRIDAKLPPSLFAFLPTSSLLFSCGHWDNSFKVSAADSGRLIQSISHHRDVVTCLTLCSEYGSTWLITGSRDCTIMVWEVFEDKPLPLSITPLNVLYGHDDAVTCLAVNLELDVIVSGSDDGSIIIHSLRDGGNYVRSIFINNSTTWSAPTPGHGSSPSAGRGDVKPTDIPRRVTWVGVSQEGYIVSYSSLDKSLWTHTLNGKFVVKREAGENLNALLISEDGKVVLSGGDRSLLVMRWVHNLELANDGLRKGFEAVLDGSNAEDSQAPMSSPIRSIYMTKKERHLLVGLENGELRVMTQV